MIGGAVLQLNKGMVTADGTTDVADAMPTAAGVSTESTMGGPALVRRRAEVQKPQLHRPVPRLLAVVAYDKVFWSIDPCKDCAR